MGFLIVGVNKKKCGVNKKDSRPVSQVLSLREQGLIIYLELRLPATTIGLPLTTFVAKNKTSSLVRRGGL